MMLETRNHSSPPIKLHFGPVHVVEPESPHTHTVILLHGRGSTGEEFAQDLLEAKLSNGKTLPEQLTTCRWVFPSSRELWSTAFEETLPAWFEAHSLADVMARQDLQMDGIRESVEYLTAVLGREVERLGGAADRVVLGGISQGGAIGLWTLLCTAGDGPAGRLGGFLGASTWLPFADSLERRWLGRGSRAVLGIAGDDVRISEADAFVERMLASSKRVSEPPLLSIPVFFGHSTDDAYVDIELGRQAAHELRKVGLAVEWREYSGAEQEGHWLKEPEELDDIVRFLASAFGLS